MQEKSNLPNSVFLLQPKCWVAISWYLDKSAEMAGWQIFKLLRPQQQVTQLALNNRQSVIFFPKGFVFTKLNGFLFLFCKSEAGPWYPECTLNNRINAF